MKQLIIVALLLFTTSAFGQGTAAIDYPLLDPPLTTDQVLSIADPAGAWSIKRIALSSILALMEAEIDTLAELNTILTDATLLDDGAIADSTAIGLTTGDLYTNFGGATDDSLNEMFAALDTAIGLLGGGDVSISGTPEAGQYTRWQAADAIEGRSVAQTQGDLSIDDLVTLSGVADGAVNLGTFTGITITDSSTIKTALQELETAVEGVAGGHDAVTLSVAADTVLALSTQELGLDTQTANYGFFGPTTGAAAAPTFRALVADDLPTATDAAQGAIELALDSEAVTGTSDAVVVTPGNLTARLAASGAIGGTTAAAGTFTTLNAGGTGFSVDADGDVVGKSFSVVKASGVAGLITLTEANSTDTDYVGMMGPASITESFSHQYPNAQPAGSIYVWATPTGTGDPNGNPVSAGTLKAAPTGDIVGTTDSQALTNKDMSGAGNTWPTFNQDTTGSAAKMSILTQTGELSFTGITSIDRTKTLRDADDTILEQGGSYTPTGTWNWSSASATWPTFNQNTTGTAGGLTAQYIDWNSASGGSSIANKPTIPTRGTLGLDTDDNPQFATIELGAATDTTISRTGAGAIAVEGAQVVLEGAATGGVILGDATPDAAGEFGYGSGKFTFFGANSEDLSIEPGNAANTALVSSSTGVTSIGLGSIGMATTGTILGGVNVINTSTNPYALSAANAYGSAIFYGATGEIDLPAGASGMAVLIYNTGAYTITIDPNGLEVIVRDGTTQTGGVSMTLNSGAGHFVSLLHNGTNWYTVGYNGTLAEGT